MTIYLRGRQPGEASGIIKEEFVKLGAAEGLFARADSEFDAVRMALSEAQPGDVVLLPTHAERTRVIELMEGLKKKKWQAGTPLP